MKSFIFGGDTGMTYEQLQSRRKIAEQMMAQTGTPRNVGEGIDSFAGSIVGALMNKKNDKREGELRDEWGNEFDATLASLTGGTQGYAAPSSFGMGGASAPVSPDQAIADDAMAALGKQGGYRESLIGTESGGNFQAQNNEVGSGGKRGHFGRVQFGRARLQDAMNAGAIPQGTTPEQFMASPRLQMAAEDWHFADLEKQLSPYVGTEVNGTPLDMGALVAMGHLGGAGGARKFIETGGRYNPSDSFGTSLADYARTHGGQGGSFAPGQGAQVAQNGGGNFSSIQKIASMMSNPMATPGQKAVLEVLLQREVQAMQPTDPMDALQRRKMELEIQGMESGGGQVPSSVQEAQFRAREAGLQPGTPEYRSFMLNGGGDPATFRALDMQAQAAGFAPGSPEYSEFMATRGAGLQAGARTTGENLADIATGGEAARVVSAGSAQGSEEGKTTAAGMAGAPSEIAQAQEGIALIDSIMTDPALPDITGMVQGRMPPMSQSGTDLNVKIKQLQGKAFLEAFESLKGGGAITEREGLAAQDAMARLDRAQSTEAYVAALGELKSIMQSGMQRAQARTSPQRTPFDPQTPDFSIMSDEELQSYIERGGR